MGLRIKKSTTLPATPGADIIELFHHGGVTPPGPFFLDDGGVLRRAGRQAVKLTASLTATSSTTLADVTGLFFPVKNGGYYRFLFTVLWQSTNTTTTIKLGLTCPTFTEFSARVGIAGLADGPNAEHQGVITSSGDSVTQSTGVEVINTTYTGDIWGVIIPTADGNLQVQYARAGGANNIQVRQGCVGFLDIA